MNKVVKERERMIEEKETMEEEETKTISHNQIQTKRPSKKKVVEEVDIKDEEEMIEEEMVEGEMDKQNVTIATK